MKRILKFLKKLLFRKHELVEVYEINTKYRENPLVWEFLAKRWQDKNYLSQSLIFTDQIKDDNCAGNVILRRGSNELDRAKLILKGEFIYWRFFKDEDIENS